MTERQCDSILPQALALVRTSIGFFKGTSPVPISTLLTAGKAAIGEPAWQGFGIEARVFGGMLPGVLPRHYGIRCGTEGGPQPPGPALNHNNDLGHVKT